MQVDSINLNQYENSYTQNQAPIQDANAESAGQQIIDSSMIEAKLLSVDIEDQEEGLTLICQKLKTNKDVLWLNNICLKLADLIVNDTTKNVLRL